ncbi:uncharacterized protein LOC132270030 [Cornus florida]|uniref:uncharacterized protein LOC132270030 n=1 Tax=Cornus florida TaxID=4283 RepID=UPI00289A5824|nr:uncharacterized protein LOC132270030 [Cornus florida]
MDASVIQRQLTGIEPLNGSNYTTWRTSVDIMLGFLDSEFVLCEEKPAAITEESSEAVKLLHAKWTKANTMAIRLIRASIGETIHGGIPVFDTAKSLLDLLKKQFMGTKKQLQYYYLTQLMSTSYDGSGLVREHIYKICKLVNGLREQGIKFDDELLVHMVIYSLPRSFDAFRVNYNSQETKWDINQLLALCVTEEERLKGAKFESAHLARSSKSMNNFKLKGGKKWNQTIQKNGKQDNKGKRH